MRDKLLLLVAVLLLWSALEILSISAGLTEPRLAVLGVFDFVAGIFFGAVAMIGIWK